jgi:hypothetical protein
LSYDGTTLTETIADTVTGDTFTTSYTLNIPALVGSTTAYIGFGGGTSDAGQGGGTSLQDIQTWLYVAPTTPPGAPSNLSATLAGEQVVLNWESNSTNEDGFAVEQSTDGASFVQIATTGRGVTSYVDMPSQPGTYYYRVRAFNAAGESDYTNSVEVDFLAPDAPPPGGGARVPAFATVFGMAFSTTRVDIPTSKADPRRDTPTTTVMPEQSTSVAAVAVPDRKEHGGAAVSVGLVRDLLGIAFARNSALVSLNALDELFAVSMMELS